MDQRLDNAGASLLVDLGLSLQLPRNRGIYLGRGAIRMGTTPSILQTVISRAASAYCAGPAEQHARLACEYAARKNLASVVCYWNRSEDSPAFVAQSYVSLLQMIAELGTDSYLSVKAPAFGFDAELLKAILKKAQHGKRFVHFDAMGPGTVDRTFRLIDQACQSYSNIGYT